MQQQSSTSAKQHYSRAAVIFLSSRDNTLVVGNDFAVHHLLLHCGISSQLLFVGVKLLNNDASLQSSAASLLSSSTVSKTSWLLMMQ